MSVLNTNSISMWFQISYGAEVGQLKFLRALNKESRQTLEFSCVNTTNTDFGNVVKIRGFNGKEIPRVSRGPKLDVRLDCKVSHV